MNTRNRERKHLGLLGGVAGVLILAGCSHGAPLSQGPYQVVTVGDYRLLTASTPQQIEHGLMFVREIPPYRGMVFVEPAGMPATFWMKNCLVGMDMVFIGAAGEIQSVQQAKPPLRSPKDRDLTVYTVQGPCSVQEAVGKMGQLPKTSFVVEVAAGDGPRFVKAWRPSMVDALLHPLHPETSNSL